MDMDTNLLCSLERDKERACHAFKMENDKRERLKKEKMRDTATCNAD